MASEAEELAWVCHVDKENLDPRTGLLKKRASTSKGNVQMYHDKQKETEMSQGEARKRRPLGVLFVEQGQPAAQLPAASDAASASPPQGEGEMPASAELASEGRMRRRKHVQESTKRDRQNDNRAKSLRSSIHSREVELHASSRRFGTTSAAIGGWPSLR